MVYSKKASKAAARHSRLRQLVPVIEGLSPELRELVVQQIEALVNLVVFLETYTNRKLALQPKAPQTRRKKAGRAR